MSTSEGLSPIAKQHLAQARAELAKVRDPQPTPITEDMAEYAAAHRTEETDHA